MGGLSDLCFDHGVRFAALVSHRFALSVSPTSPLPQSAFRLVANFGRSAIRINVDSVGLMLQVCLGGIAKDFSVSHLLGWMFSFYVSCKDIGFMIYKLHSFSCKSYALFFHLWSGGGPNWHKEFALWCDEQDAEWTTVGSKFKKSYADIVRSSPSHKVQVPPKKIHVFCHLLYPNDYYKSFSANPSVKKPMVQAPNPPQNKPPILE